MGGIYEFSVSNIDLATEYEWVVTGAPCGATIYNTRNYASVYAIFPSTNTIKVRAKNGSEIGAWRTYPFEVIFCDNKSSSIVDNGTVTQQFENLSQLKTKESSNEVDGIQIFPNPAKNRLYLQFSDGDDVVIKIFDLKGIVCKRIHANNKKLTINTSDLNSSLYIIKIILKNRTETRKIEIYK